MVSAIHKWMNYTLRNLRNYVITLYFNLFLISISYIALLISFVFNIIYLHFSLFVTSSPRMYRIELEKWRAIRASVSDVSGMFTHATHVNTSPMQAR